MQNKLHYAAHGHTAAEVIYKRVDSEKNFMGLTSFSGEVPTLKDIKIAKNYLDQDELKILNNLVSGYFDFAEIQAIKKNPMHMSDYIKHLDNILLSTGESVLQDAGQISNKQAMEKAEKEYREYQKNTLTSIEKEYFSTIKKVEKNVKQKAKL